MNTKTVKVLSGCALGIQMAALIFTVLIFICQEQVKVIFSATAEIQGVTTFPFANMVIHSVPVLLYFILLVFAHRAEEKKQTLGTTGIVLFVMICLLNLGFSLLSRVEVIITATKGAIEVASLSVVNSAINMVTSPLTLVAFGLFSMAVGAGLRGREYAECRIS